jgi:adenylate kinase
VLLGPPGVGKGTQAEILAEKTGLPHVSSGDLFHENMKNRTELGKQAQAFVDKGELVPDDLTIAMVEDRLSRPDCRLGAILDGFPRTPAQADALRKMLADHASDVGVVPFPTRLPMSWRNAGGRLRLPHSRGTSTTRSSTIRGSPGSAMRMVRNSSGAG